MNGLVDTFRCHIHMQLKIDEFESNVNEIKDPFPPADFPGESLGTFFVSQEKKKILNFL